jgi:photosynthetic reaction center cytochrome c subunit
MRTSSVVAPVLFGAVLALDPHAVLGEQAKTAGEAFKNVQVLKRVPANQWFETMAFIAGSLGVTCDHCHSSEFETDEGNPNKLKAREMMRMVDDINREHFNGKVVVTCNTCHRGSVKPQGAPIPDAEHWKKAAEEFPPPPAAQEILARYRKTISNVKNQSISLRIERYGGHGPARLNSTAMLLDGRKARISERENKSSRILIRDGTNAWIDEGKGWRAMSEGESFDAFEVADVFVPDQVGAVEPAGGVFHDRINGLRKYVVPVTSKEGRKWLFFDPDTCLLLKQRQLFSSFYGDGSVDINYSDFKKFGKEVLPTKVEVVNAGGAGLIVRRVISRRVNITIGPDDFRANSK